MQNTQQEAIVAEAETAEKPPPAALAILRGVTRVMATHGLATVSELPLPNGRRADAIALARDGDIFIVEIKSSVEDFRSDHKWQDYRECCDKLYFAVQPGFPIELLPEDTGLILADAYGGEIVREAPEHRLPPARRKSMTIRFARAAASRLTAILDPALNGDPTSTQ